jgi:hypothetical protein
MYNTRPTGFSRVHLEEMELAQLLLHFLMEHQGQRASEVI